MVLQRIGWEGGGGGRWRLCLVVMVYSSAPCCLTSTEPSRSGLTVRPFQGARHIQQLQCSAEPVSMGADLISIVVYQDTKDQVLAIYKVVSKQCIMTSEFVSCSVDREDPRKSAIKVLVMDLAEEESRVYGCDVTTLNSKGQADKLSWSVRVRHRRTTTTVAPTTTTSTTTTVRPQPASESPVASGVKSNVQEFQLPISVVIIGLVLLLFFAILCAILVILQCRGKRRRRSRAANRESLLSAKNEPMGEGGYRTPRNVPSYPPGHMPPETPGGNFAMRYQKSIPDTGYVSGSSVYYSEPYGTLDEEMKERLRPNPRMCHIPYDIKGGPLDTNHPQEHSA